MSRAFANGLVEALNSKVEMINSKIIQAERIGSSFKNMCGRWRLAKIVSSSILQQDEYGANNLDEFECKIHVHDISLDS
jgi:hypothetical protein